jgi:hypothetical protein
MTLLLATLRHCHQIHIDRDNDGIGCESSSDQPEPDPEEPDDDGTTDGGSSLDDDYDATADDDA